jgi:hypothetical protein
MKPKLKLSFALLLAAGTAASAQSLSTGFTGNTIISATAADTGMMFDVTALNPGGITINSFAIHSRELAGVPVTVSIYTKAGSYVGFHNDPSAWTLVGTVETSAAGAGLPTPVALGGLILPAGSVHAMYINVVTAGGTQRYYTAAQLPVEDPANDDLRIHIRTGGVTTGLFPLGVTSPRGWNGTIHYTAGGQALTGACCLPNGTCEIMGQVSCQNAQGAYNGDNTQCATIPPCAQPGACCLPQGGCAILSEGQCIQILGTYNGNSSTCAAANCAGGACCLPDGSCIFTIEWLCNSEFQGTFNGDGTTCGGQRCATLPTLWNNGPMVTSAGFGCNGGDISALETSQNTNTYGFSFLRPNLAVADNFTIPAGETWTINEIVTWGYQTGATSVSINSLGVQIWNGRPGDPGAAVVAGSIGGNCLTSATFSNIYRALSTEPANCDRRLQELTCGLGTVLGPGTYWVEFTAAGSHPSGPWIPPVKFLFRPNKPFADARLRNSAGWDNLIDNGAGRHQQEVPFVIKGSLGGSICYANCDQSTVQPILNVDDFTCFINRYAQAQVLPHEQQVTDYANCDGSTVAPVLNVDDFTCFINRYAQGCP